jgi:hypothetical protein
MENLAFNSVGKSSIQLGTLKFQMNLNIQEEKKKRLNVKNLGGSFLKNLGVKTAHFWHHFKKAVKRLEYSIHQVTEKTLKLYKFAYNYCNKDSLVENRKKYDQ